MAPAWFKVKSEVLCCLLLVLFCLTNLFLFSVFLFLSVVFWTWGICSPILDILTRSRECPIQSLSVYLSHLSHLSYLSICISLCLSCPVLSVLTWPDLALSWPVLSCPGPGLAGPGLSSPGLAWPGLVAVRLTNHSPERKINRTRGSPDPTPQASKDL